MKDKTVKEHFVPVFYLKEFVDTNGRLNVYNRLGKNYFSCRPREICCSNNLYEIEWKEKNDRIGKFVCQNEIEKNFSEYESDFATLIGKIKNSCENNKMVGDNSLKMSKDLILNKEEKKELIFMLVNFFMRNPVTMKAMELDQLPVDADLIQFRDELQKVLEIMQVGNAESIMLAAQKKSTLIDMGYGSNIGNMHEDLKNAPIVLFYSEKGDFITTDVPAQLFYDSNINDKNNMCGYMTLTPKIAILIGNYHVSKKMNNRLVTLPDEYIVLLNSINAKKCGRFIISHNEKTLRNILNKIG